MITFTPGGILKALPSGGRKSKGGTSNERGRSTKRTLCGIPIDEWIKLWKGYIVHFQGEVTKEKAKTVELEKRLKEVNYGNRLSEQLRNCTGTRA